MLLGFHQPLPPMEIRIELSGTGDDGEEGLVSRYLSIIVSQIIQSLA